MEKSDLANAIANQSDLSLAEAANAVEFVLHVMSAERAPVGPDNSSPEGDTLPLLRRLPTDGADGSESG